MAIILIGYIYSGDAGNGDSRWAAEYGKSKNALDYL